MQVVTSRLKFYSDLNSTAMTSIDTQLQAFLQSVVDLGGSIIAVQQTRTVDRPAGGTFTGLDYVEFLVVALSNGGS
jgi:hypothetical protein